MVENPFIQALRLHPNFPPSHVVRHDSGDAVPVPGVVVRASQVEERLDVPGDAWGFEVEITARRGSGDYGKLDIDAAAIEYVTTTAMAGDPNISYLLAEDGVTTEQDTDGKARTFAMTIPVLVVFS